MRDAYPDKSFMIKAYFDDLENRVDFLKELRNRCHRDEALMLCCCYIEALGNRQYQDSNNKKNFYKILIEFSGNGIFEFVHPKQLKKVLNCQKCFQVNIDQITPIVDGFRKELIPQEKVIHCLAPVATEIQKRWLDESLYKGTMAAIAYEQIRSDLVHGISGSEISFSETTFNGKPVPDINFEMLYTALVNIVNSLKKISLKTNSWYWEQ